MQLLKEANKMVGDKIKKARLLAGLTQRQLGELIGGKGVSTVSEWESGKRSPDIELIPIIAQILNVQPAFFVDETRDITLNLSTPKSEYDPLSEQEHVLLDAYRAADDRAREDALKTLLDHPRKKESQSAI
jgi:transcriptional regulator with XRE-family HTH domain